MVQLYPANHLLVRPSFCAFARAIPTLKGGLGETLC